MIGLYAGAAQAYQPCVPDAGFCVQFVNASRHAVTIQSKSSISFEIPGLQGLTIPAGETTSHIPAFGGSGLHANITASWILTITPVNSKNPIHCTMYYNNPVTFEPGGCGEALSTANPYNMIVSFRAYGSQ